MKSFSIQEINEVLKGEISGSFSGKIIGPEQIEKARENQHSFIGNLRYAKLWESPQASAAIIDAKIDLEPGEGRGFIRVKNPDLAMAKVLELFCPEPPVFETDIHPTAVIHASAVLGE